MDDRSIGPAAVAEKPWHITKDLFSRIPVLSSSCSWVDTSVCLLTSRCIPTRVLSCLSGTSNFWNHLPTFEMLFCQFNLKYPLLSYRRIIKSFPSMTMKRAQGFSRPWKCQFNSSSGWFQECSLFSTCSLETGTIDHGACWIFRDYLIVHLTIEWHHWLQNSYGWQTK